MKEEDKCYAAAVIDDSSWMSIRSGGGWMSMIRIRRLSPVVVQYLHQVFGGNLSQEKKGWVLVFYGDNCTDFLVKILPFMRIRIRQAQILMELNYQIQKRHASGVGPKRLTDEEKRYREKLDAELKSLK